MKTEMKLNSKNYWRTIQFNWENNKIGIIKRGNKIQLEYKNNKVIFTKFMLVALLYILFGL